MTKKAFFQHVPGSGSLTAALSKPLASSAEYGDRTWYGRIGRLFDTLNISSVNGRTGNLKYHTDL
jgi:hypothetical protein